MSSTNTPNLALNKATPGTSEPFNTTTVNTNWDKIDTAVGVKSSKFVTTTVGNTTTETSVMSLSINAPVQGSVYKVVAWGTNDHAASAVLTFRGKLGGTTFSTHVASFPASILTNQPWRFELEITVLTLGVSGTWRPAMNGMLWVNGVTVAALQIPTASITKDTTVTEVLELTVQWTAASASSIARCDSGYAYRVTNA